MKSRSFSLQPLAFSLWLLFYLPASAQIPPARMMDLLAIAQQPSGNTTFAPSTANLVARWRVSDLALSVNGSKTDTITPTFGTTNLYQSNIVRQSYWTNNVSILNGHPWLQADSNVGFTNNTFALSQPYSVLAVAMIPTFSGNRYFIDYTGSGNEVFAYVNGGGALGFGADSFAAGSGAAIAAGTWVVVQWSFAGASSLITTNGVLYASVLDTGTKAFQSLTVGNNAGISNSRWCWAEVLIYATASPDMTAWTNYTHWYYGVP